MADKFRKNHSLDERRICAANLRSKYPNRIPILLERAKKEKTIPEVSSYKFLVPAETTMGQFVYEVRKYTTIKSFQSLYLFVNDTLIPNSQPLAETYARYRDEDGFLYMVYSGENTFG